MFQRPTIMSLLLATMSLVPSAIAAADEDGQTTVALTAAVDAQTDQSRRDLMGVLLALLEPEIAMQPRLSVVERRQIDRALQELALSEDLGRNAATRLQLGKIVSADLILTLEWKPPDTEGETPHVLIRVVESLTGIVRGVAVAPVEEAQLDETSRQIVRYLAWIATAPDKPLTTVAVAPFESLSRFDRLRPLERGLRDMIATRLVRWSDTLAEQGSGFQVLQRSSMQQLLRELEMIQSGLVDRSRLPANLPTRAAAFLIRGRIDESNEGGELRVIVSGELVHAASNKSVREFTFAVKPDQLEAALAHEVDLLAGRLLSSGDEVSQTPGPLRKLHEVDALLHRVAADLRRFRRVCPIDFSYRDFELPTKGVPVGPPIMPADSPLGLAILKKSIDRLEAALFIEPDRGDAAYALGYCYAFHIDGIWNSDRADELLRRAVVSAPDGKLGAGALRLLAEISFHHHSGMIAEGAHARAYDQMFYAFQNMPDEYRDELWVRLLSTMSPLLSQLDDPTKRMQLIEVAAAQAEREGSPHKRGMAMAVNRLVAGLKPHGRAADPTPLLRRWVEGDDPTLSQLGARSLAQISERQAAFAQAATWYLLGADALSASNSMTDVTARDNMRIHAARCLRKAEKPLEARELLESFVPQDHTSLNYGYYAVELGLCYMQFHENEKALEVMVTAAEMVRGLSDNSRVEQYIQQLGGVPLREDRDVDVQYFPGPDGNPLHTSTLATDGTRLFTPGEFHNGTRVGVSALDVGQRSWKSLTNQFGGVTSMSVHDGVLWVGTANEGIWRCILSINRWTQWSIEQGLPDDRITVLTATANGVFAGVGTPAAGGVIQITSEDKVRVFDGQYAPAEAPSFLVVQGQQLLAATRTGVHEFTLAEQRWTKSTPAGGLRAIGIFPGRSHAWASAYRREIFPYGAAEAEAKRFQAAWFQEMNGPAGITMLFAIEHNDQLWFGGHPFARFRSVGFYRIDPQTGEFYAYSLRDGFRMSTTYTTRAAVTIGNDLWVATSAGLARVTPRHGRQKTMHEGQVLASPRFPAGVPRE